MTWYKKALSTTYHKEFVAGGLVFVTLFVLSIIQLVNGEPFVWKHIEPFSTPDLWNRIFWSALTFVTLGAVLYRIYFYKILSMIFGSDRSSYRQMKRIIWFGLMYVNYQIFPAVVDTANFTTAILFNSLVYIVYISPFLLTGLILGALLGVCVERKAVLSLIRSIQ
jgi:hypothetical protein